MATPFSGTPQSGRKRPAAAAVDVPDEVIAVPRVPADQETCFSSNASLLTPEPAVKRRACSSLGRGGLSADHEVDAVGVSGGDRGSGRGRGANVTDGEGEAEERGGGGRGGGGDADDGVDAAGGMFTPGTNTAHLLLQLRRNWVTGALSPIGNINNKPTASSQLRALRDDDGRGLRGSPSSSSASATPTSVAAAAAVAAVVSAGDRENINSKENSHGGLSNTNTSANTSSFAAASPLRSDQHQHQQQQQRQKQHKRSSKTADTKAPAGGGGRGAGGKVRNGRGEGTPRSSSSASLGGVGRRAGGSSGGGHKAASGTPGGSAGRAISSGGGGGGVTKNRAATRDHGNRGALAGCDVKGGDGAGGRGALGRGRENGCVNQTPKRCGSPGGAATGVNKLVNGVRGVVPSPTVRERF